MGFIINAIRGKEHKWVWYLTSLLGAALPIVISSIINITGENFSWMGFYTIVDIAFLGLGMNISNISLIGNKDFPEKEVFLLITFALMVVTAICLGFIYGKAELGLYFNGLLHFLVFISVIFALEVNEFIYELVSKK